MGTLPEQSPARVIERLEEELARMDRGRSALLAFDGDGTLWSGDIGDELFEGLLSRRALTEAVHAPLQSEAKAYRIGVRSEDPHQVARALFDAYRGGAYPEDRVFAMMAWVLAGHTEAEADGLARAVLAERPVDGRIHEGALEVVAWARRRSIEVWTVSASPRPMVIAAVELLDLAPDRVLAMTPAVEAGRLAARIEGEVTYGEGKSRALARARPDSVWLGVFGDSGWDAAMMKDALVPIAIDPKPSLLARAPEVPGLVTLTGRHTAGRVATAALPA